MRKAIFPVALKTFGGLLFILFAQPFTAFAQSYNLKIYNTTSGLPGNQINDMLQDRHGRLWIATMNGVAIFNGENFQRFEKSNPVSSSPVKSLFEDRQGNIWIGMLRKGVSKFNKAEQVYYDKSDGLIGDDIHAIAQDHLGNIWLGTSSGLSRYDGKRFSTYTALRGLVNDQVNAIKLDSKNRLWIATMGGVSMFDGTKFKNYTTSNGLPSNLCFSLHENERGELLVGTYTGIAVFNNNRFEPSVDFSMVANDRIEDITGNPSNKSLAISTYNNGVTIFSDNRQDVISMRNGLPSSIVKSVIKDREGTYWIGTWSGLCKWNSEHFSTYSYEDGLANNNLLSISKDNSGRIYFGTLTGGLSYLDNGGMQSIGAGSGLSGLTIWSMLTLEDGNVWLGTDFGPALFDPRKKTVSQPFFELNHLTIYSVTKDKNGFMYFGTDDGLRMTNPMGDVVESDPKSVLANKKIRSVYHSSTGNIWIGTTNGLYILKENKVIDLNQKLNIPKSQVTSISSGPQNQTLVSTYENGIYILDDDRSYRHLGTKQGLSSDNTLCVFSDSKSRLWIGSIEGVDVLDAVTKSGTKVEELFHFNRSNGFNGAETNAICEDTEGNIWFATINGAFKFSSRQTLPKSVLPLIHISNISLLLKDTDWKNKKISLSPESGLPQDLILPYNNNHVTFNFEGVYLNAPDEIRYQFLLEGFDLSWSPPTSRPFAVYSNLDPGSYNFKVRCSANGKNWTIPVTYSFAIKPPFWKTTFFYILYVVAGIGGFFLVTKLRTLNLERTRNLLQGLVNERTKELNEKNKELEKLSLVASETGNSVMVFSSNGKIEWVNEGFRKMTGYNLEDFRKEFGDTISDFTFERTAATIAEKCVDNKVSDVFESQLKCLDGSLKWVSHTLTPVFDNKGALSNFVVIDTDITVRREMEQRIRESLEEKGLLLREIHHRVKNNLQIIISLFNLQSHYVDDKKAMQALKEGQDRIKSMALIHERFYQNDGLSKIDFDEYIKRLVENLFLSFQLKPERVKSVVEADKISLDIDTAVPCGLIINELVSNSLKHAFGDDGSGNLYVSLKYLSKDMVRLIVSDDGVGLPAGFDIEKYDSLGMQLISALSSQLEGKLKLLPGKGTTFELDFKVPDHG
ncbi:MAG: two-component regulator propeller domain-containing protein [Bacteroidota bacterium]